MATNVSASYQAAIRRQLSREVLPITQRYLVAQQFAKKEKLEKGAGVTWTATRFNRLPLPAAPLSEGVPPTGEQLTISQVTGVALQWGDKITLSDVAVITTMYDLIQQSKRLLGVQIAELMERNTYAILMGGAQVNYVNQRGSRANIVAGDVLDVVTINRTFSDLENLGAPFYNGQMEPDVTREIEHGTAAADKTQKTSDHYVSIVSPLVENDLRQNSTIVNAWSYSDISKLYINEIGYWAGIHFTKSNMVPHWLGAAAVNGGTATTGGSLVSATAYTIVVTATDALNLYGEVVIYQHDTAITPGGGEHRDFLCAAVDRRLHLQRLYRGRDELAVQSRDHFDERRWRADDRAAHRHGDQHRPRLDRAADRPRRLPGAPGPSRDRRHGLSELRVRQRILRLHRARRRVLDDLVRGGQERSGQPVAGDRV